MECGEARALKSVLRRPGAAGYRHDLEYEGGPAWRQRVHGLLSDSRLALLSTWSVPGPPASVWFGTLVNIRFLGPVLKFLAH